jgi:hypothetical protein
MTIKEEMFEPRAKDSSSAIAEYLRRSISLSEIMACVWNGRIVVIICAVLGLLYGIYAVYDAGPLFNVEVSLLPAESSSIDSGSSNSGALGLIAGITGSSLGGASKFTQFLSALSSTGVGQMLDQKYNMSCRVFASDCDQKTLQWRHRTGFRAWLNGITSKLSGLPDPNGPHTPIELAQYVESQVIVTTDKTSQIVKLNYLSSKPEFAARFMSLLITTTNDYIRLQDRSVLRQYVGYLTNQASQATNVAQRDALDQLLLQQERKLMLSEVDVPYAATVLDGPTIAPMNSAIKRIVIYTMLGGIVGSLIVLGASKINLRKKKYS